MSSLPPLAVALPLLIATALVAVEKLTENRRLLDVTAIATTSAILVIDLLLLKQSLNGTVVTWFGGWSPERNSPLGIAFTVDPASAWLAALAALLTLAGIVFSWHHFKAVGIFYHSLMLLFLGSMEGFCLTGDLFNMFVFFELMGVAAYALTGYKIEDTGPIEGALNFSVMNSLGAIFVLFGIAIVYSRTGALNMAKAGETIATGGADTGIVVAFMLLSIGFLVKGAIVPFHFWLPDAHGVAPTPASVLFSGIMVELGLYAVARIYWTVFKGMVDESVLSTLFVGTGAVTAIAGAFMCFLQRHLKRMLAFSTVSHAGMILAGIGLLRQDALSGILLYIAGHGCVKGALFICSGIILHRCRSVDEETLRGRCRDLPITGVLFTVAGLALAGLPPFATFAGKAVVEQAASEMGRNWLPSIFLLASALTGGTVLRAACTMFRGWGAANIFSLSAPASGDKEHAETKHHEKGTPWVMWLPALFLLVIACAAGSAASIAGMCDSAAGRFVDTSGYRETVLLGVRGAEEQPPHTEAVSEMGKGMAGAALAIAIAAAALFSHRLPDRVLERVQSIATPFLDLARSLHSGQIGDYAAWFIVGSALLLLSALKLPL